MDVIAGDSELQSTVLEELASAVNYRRWLCELGAAHFGSDVLEIGSGLGFYASEWAAMGANLTVSEADSARLDALHRRFADNDRVSVRELAVPITETAAYSTVVAYNVLEHIADDVDALRAFRGMLRPRGTVILVVPAFQFAMSKFDREIGHCRRYTRASLRSALDEADLQVEQCHYINAPGLLAWYIACRLLRGRPKEGRLLTVYDKAIVPLAAQIDRIYRPPFGQSVFAVGRRG